MKIAGKFISRKFKLTVIIIVLLVAIRLALPYIILYYGNKSLANIKGYYGHINDVDLSLYRGAYQLKGFYLNKVDKSGKQTDFFKFRMADLSVEWKALFHGSLVGELIFDSCSLVFEKDKTEIGQVKKDTSDFRKILKDFMPLKVNRFEVNKGAIHYVDKTAKPVVDVSLQDTYILAQNLRNVVDEKKELPSTVTAHAKAYEGTLSLNMKMDALAKNPAFDLNAGIKNTNLVLLNDFLKAYGGFDVTRGSFGLYTEFASKDGNYKGYVKPLIKDLKVLGPQDRKDNFLQKIWEGLVGGVGMIFKNQKKDQVATKIPIEGSYDNSTTDLVETIWELLRNAFIQALMPSVDNEININSAKETEPEKKEKSLPENIFKER